MRWNLHKPVERVRSNKVVPRGGLAVNDTTGAMRVGDGHTVLGDLEDIGGDSGGDTVVPGYRVARQTFTPATPAMEDGVVITTLAYGEKVVGLRVGIEEAWDGLWEGEPSPAGIKIGTPNDDDAYSGGIFSMEVEDIPADVPWTGLLNSNIIDQEYISSATGYAPPEGIDVIVTIDDGGGNSAMATTGIAHVVLFIQTGFV